MTPDEVDWSVTTWQGNRLRQHREFLALPLRDKLRMIEQMAEVARAFPAKPAAGQESDSGTPPSGGESNPTAP